MQPVQHVGNIPICVSQTRGYTRSTANNGHNGRHLSGHHSVLKKPPSRNGVGLLLWGGGRELKQAVTVSATLTSTSVLLGTRKATICQHTITYFIWKLKKFITYPQVKLAPGLETCVCFQHRIRAIHVLSRLMGINC